MEDFLRVVILDSSRQAAQQIAEQLQGAGFKLDWMQAATPQEFEQALQTLPSLVLAGNPRPPFNVLQALSQLKSRKIKIPFIIISGEASLEMAVRGLKQGAEDILLRDRLDRLGEAVRQALAVGDLPQGKVVQGRLSSQDPPAGGQSEIEVILSVNAALRNLPNREVMLPVIAEKILGIAAVDRVLISLLEAASGQLQPVHASGKWKDIPGFGLGLDDSILKTIYREGTALRWDPPVRAEEVSITPQGIDPGCLICLPLISSQENIGLIWLGCEEVCPDESFRLAQVVANIAATAIHRSSLNENTLRALQESEALANISRILNQNLDLDRIFRQIVQEAIGIIGDAYRAVIHLYDEKNQRLYAVALGEVNQGQMTLKSLVKIRVSATNEFDFGVISEQDVLSASMQAGKGVAGKVIEGGEPMIVGDTIQDRRYVQTGLETEARSLVVAPILSGKRRLGTLSVLGGAPNLFSTADQNLLEKLCLQVSIAIENARLLESERQQRELAQTQAEISALLNQTLSMHEVLAGILNYTLRFFSAKAANIMLVQEESLKLARHIGYNQDENPSIFDLVKVAELAPDDPLRIAYESGQKITAMDTREASGYKKKLTFEWVRSSVVIPLKVGSRVIGLLNVDSEEPNAFGKLEHRQLDIFANSASVAVNNAQLYQVLEETLQIEKSTRLQLIRADKLAGMGRMVASVAHELNNPLQTIKNCLFLIEQSFVQEDADLLELTMSEVERLTSIVNRLRDVYRPVDSNEFQQVPLRPLLADLEMMLETHLRRHAVELEMHIDGSQHLFVHAIPDQLKQVFLNLSLNGIEAMQPDGGKLSIQAQFDPIGERVGMMFSDTGAGIPEEDLKLIFDPFYTTKTTGMGLGLSICYDIVQNHNGMIEVRNNQPHGVTFTVWLPASPQA